MKHETLVKRRMAFTFAALLLTVAFLLPVAGQEDVQSKKEIELFLKAHAHFQQGNDRLGRNDLEGAAGSLQRCLELLPRHDRAHFLLAEIRLKQRRLPEAETHIRAAEQSFFPFREWYRQHFSPYLDELRGKQVANRLRLSVLGESNATASCGMRRHITYAATSLRSQDSAINTILAAFPPREETIPAVYHYVHGNIHFLSGRHDQARKEYELTLQKDPRHGGACNNLANLYYMGGQMETARKYLEKAVKNGVRVNPEFRKALKQNRDN